MGHAQAKYCKILVASLKDILKQALELYIPSKTFVFLHCWMLLKEVVQWQDYLVEVWLRQHLVISLLRMAKRNRPSAPLVVAEVDGVDGEEEVEILSNVKA